MTGSLNPFPFPLEEFRSYLLLIVRGQIDPRWGAKFDASDIVQQTLLVAQRDAGTLQGRSRGEMARWLRQIMNRILANEIRGMRAQKRESNRDRPIETILAESSARFDRGLEDPTLPPDAQAEQAEQFRQLAHAVSDLPAAQQEAVILRYFQGWSLEEIASHLGRSYTAAASLIHHGLTSLRDRLKQPH